MYCHRGTGRMRLAIAADAQRREGGEGGQQAVLEGVHGALAHDDGHEQHHHAHAVVDRARRCRGAPPMTSPSLPTTKIAVKTGSGKKVWSNGPKSLHK